MTDDALPQDQRWLDLLAMRLAGELSAEQEQELAQLMAEHPQEDLADWERLAGEVALAKGVELYEPLPNHVHEKLLAKFAVLEKGLPSNSRQASGVSLVQPATATTSAWQQAGWIIAAASLLLALFGWLRPTTVEQPPVAIQPAKSFAERRAELIALAKQPGQKIIQLNWTATADPSAQGASGDVVWDNARQEGYMRFRGLAKNDPKLIQYQLWIFDQAQDERYPIDGGVFDIDESTGDVIVPIQAKLPVAQPTMFAITVEKPGGVVVSSRERLPLLAKLE